ncbi:xanthine dehydrogenase accessory protein XdhC [Sphingomonas oleivorans]|uniref:Xanthine dehydrogenase accessory protein XdhC n=1 Tax=Sphingomonas oleivorans TaxID=1735121 RepID=A0A2T5FYB8_9SPHN|nr:xanthine dehydrogenase accessory protein XdhC [Sphingomonas oleivorans]PTQ11529.1 xanthine dehydrogenase accessory protein XdhC [Sphingomonas oleivorans]
MLDLLDKGKDAALVTILATEGSVPREAGTRMIVTHGMTIGTIGGGNLEYRAIEQARLLLDQPAGAWRVQDYPLGPLLGQCCGGRVRLLIEHVDMGQAEWLAAVRDGTGLLETIFEEGGLRRTFRGTEPGNDPARAEARGPRPMPGDRVVERIGADLMPLHLFGAGHVGAALARILPGLPFDLHWYDNRADVPSGVTILDDDALAERARRADGPILIMTHDHGLDYRLVSAALDGRASFVGLIGSATKRARFLSRLAKDGYGEAAIARLHCPIGVPGIAGKEPEVIAVAVAAELLMLRGAA